MRAAVLILWTWIRLHQVASVSHVGPRGGGGVRAFSRCILCTLHHRKQGRFCRVHGHARQWNRFAPVAPVVLRLPRYYRGKGSSIHAGLRGVLSFAPVAPVKCRHPEGGSIGSELRCGFALVPPCLGPSRHFSDTGNSNCILCTLHHRKQGRFCRVHGHARQWNRFAPVAPVDFAFAPVLPGQGNLASMRVCGVFLVLPRLPR